MLYRERNSTDSRFCAFVRIVLGVAQNLAVAAPVTVLFYCCCLGVCSVGTTIRRGMANMTCSMCQLLKIAGKIHLVPGGKRDVHRFLSWPCLFRPSSGCRGGESSGSPASGTEHAPNMRRGGCRRLERVAVDMHLRPHRNPRCIQTPRNAAKSFSPSIWTTA